MPIFKLPNYLSRLYEDSIKSLFFTSKKNYLKVLNNIKTINFYGNMGLKSIKKSMIKLKGTRNISLLIDDLSKSTLHIMKILLSQLNDENNLVNDFFVYHKFISFKISPIKSPESPLIYY